jgi:hypothetical protein
MCGADVEADLILRSLVGKLHPYPFFSSREDNLRLYETS